MIFQENVSFDHYFATYPKAKNQNGKPKFVFDIHTPPVNNLLSAGLLNHNPNSANPYRLDRSMAITCDMNHGYTAEQKEYNGGLLNGFINFSNPSTSMAAAKSCDFKQSMGYFDGNTVTALCNYAQHFAISDNFFSTTFGPSTPGALNLVLGQTHGATPINQIKNYDNESIKWHGYR